MDFGFVLSQILTGLSSASSLFLIASGLTIIFGVTRIVNFAHGSLYMLGAYCAYTATESLMAILGSSLGFWVGILLTAVFVGLIGLFLEFFLLRWLYKSPELFQLLATFGVVLIVQDLVPFLWGGEDLLGPRAPGFKGAIEILGWSFPRYELFMILIGPCIWGGLWLLFHKTRWGILVRAATEDRETVATLGINQAWLFRSVLFLGAFLAGLAGALQLPKEPANSLMDINIIAEAFVVTVIGGMGSVTGAFLAALLIGLLQAFGILIFPKITLVFIFLVMAFVLMIRPNGLLGKYQTVETYSKQNEGPHDLTFITLPRIFITLGVCALLPLGLGDFEIFVLTEILVFALFAFSLNFLMGFGGMISFGHAAYFGLGAYAAALMTHHFQAGLPLALFASPILPLIAAALFGWFCTRMSGVYLAMLTLAFAQILWSIAFQWVALTGGDNGLIGIWPPKILSDRLLFYYFALSLIGFVFILLYKITLSPFGLLLRAARDSSKRLSADGVHVGHLRWAAFLIAGASAGLAGGLYSFAKGSIDPHILSIPLSVDGLSMVLMGGIQTLLGPLMGSAALTFLKTTVMSLTENWRFFMGSAIVFLVLVFPRGLVGSLIHVFALRKAARSEKTERSS